jgi:hypothetical protein
MMENLQPLKTRENLLVIDIHDHIQQQMFALALQVGTLKLLLKRDPDAALKGLHKIEHLLELLQLDLNSMRLGLKVEHSKFPEA